MVSPELICFVITISQSNSLIFFTNAGFCTFITNSLLNALFVISLIEFLQIFLFNVLFMLVKEGKGELGTWPM